MSFLKRVIQEGFHYPIPFELSFVEGQSPILDIPSLQAYYDVSVLSSLFQDAACTVPVTSDGDVVGCVQDLTGNGFDKVQSVTARKPIYRFNNGNPFLEYNGSKDMSILSSTGSFKYLHNGTGGEANMGVNIPVANPDAVYYFMSNHSGATGNVGMNMSFRDDSPTFSNQLYSQILRGVGGTMAANTSSASNNDNCSTLTNLVFGFSFSATTLNLYNDSALASTAPVTNAPSAANSTGNMIFGETNTGGSPATFRYFGHATYNEVLSTGDRSKATDYWKGRMG